jgi:prefoldin subunit 5
MHLLGGDVEPPVRQVAERAAPLEEQVESLRREIHELREEFLRFRRQFEESPERQ